MSAVMQQARVHQDRTTRTSWGTELWSVMQPVYEDVLHHGFLAGLSDGSLPVDRFAHYLMQDTLYLRSYSRTLAALAARAPESWMAITLTKHALGAVEAEMTLHAELLPQLEVPTPPEDPGPTTVAYTAFLQATVLGEDFAEGLAAVLPCYWIYERVGSALVDAGSPNPRYQRWIDTYAGEDFGAVVSEVLGVVEAVGEELTVDQRQAGARRALTAARYEWMFWDAAYRAEQWPI